MPRFVRLVRIFEKFSSYINRSGQFFPRSGEHQLEAVLLIDSAGTGIVVYGDDIYVGISFFDGAHHTLAADMIWQAAERLHADNILNTAACQFQHFRSEQPALSHFDAITDIALV